MKEQTSSLFFSLFFCFCLCVFYTGNRKMCLGPAGRTAEIWVDCVLILHAHTLKGYPMLQFNGLLQVCCGSDWSADFLFESQRAKFALKWKKWNRPCHKNNLNYPTILLLTLLNWGELREGVVHRRSSGSNTVSSVHVRQKHKHIHELQWTLKAQHC